MRWVSCLLKSSRKRQDGDAKQAARSHGRSARHSILEHRSPIPQTFSHPQLPGRDVQPVWLRVDGGDSRSETLRARVEFRQQNGFAGLNPFWSQKVFLASLQQCPAYCGKALSTDHHFASAKGSVTRFAERGWGTKSFLAEKHLFITTGE